MQPCWVHRFLPHLTHGGKWFEGVVGIFQRGWSVEAEALKVHFPKSTSLWQPRHSCFLSNSSEKISISFPQLGQLQRNDFRFPNSSNPGQCCGVLIHPPVSFLEYRKIGILECWVKIDFTRSLFPLFQYSIIPCYFPRFSRAPTSPSRGGLLLISWISI